MPVDRKEILSKLHQLPSLPEVLNELIASLNNADMDTTILAHKIERDQGLSAKVLRMSNSSFYGLPRKVGSIHDAVTVLGFDSVRSLVLSTGMIGLFPPIPGSVFDRQSYWKRCYRIATISKALGRNLGEGKQLAFAAGMFCEIGQLLLELCIPKQFSEILKQQEYSELSLIELEESQLGFNHFDIGADIIHFWNFPLEIEQLIRNWTNSDSKTKFDPLECVVHIAASVESGVIGEELIEELSQTWCARMHVTWPQIEAALPDANSIEAFDMPGQ
jgi:HD-like signal output (HDOD) protein